MSLVDSGNHWEVISGFIQDVDQLHLAGRQAVRLSLFGDGELVQTAPTRGKHLAVKRVAVDWLRQLSPAEDFAELLHVFDQAREAISSDTNEAYINVLATFGNTGEHRDQIASETLGVSLQGEAVAKIQDPVSGGWSEFRLRPGDAIHFDNNYAPEHQRPLHIVSNSLVARRVSLVINADRPRPEPVSELAA